LSGLSASAEAPSLKLTVYQPKLRFAISEKDSNKFVNTASPSTASGFRQPQPQWTVDENPPYVGNALAVYIVAWDTVQNLFCGHCNFILKETSTTNNDALNGIWDKQGGIVQSDAVQIKNGRQTVSIRGQDVVGGTNFATWRITGPTSYTSAEWTNLQFRDAPIPMPLGSYIYDRNR